MGFEYGYKIERGVYKGRCLMTTAPFPQSSGAEQYSYFSGREDGQIWDQSGMVIHYFNEQTSLMLDITGYFLEDHQIGSEILLAAIPLYVGSGTPQQAKTGYIDIFLQKQSNTFYYVLFKVEDINGNPLGGWTGQSGFTIQSGGWADATVLRCFLALAGWEVNGVKMLGMYLNATQHATEPYNDEYGDYWQACGSCIRLNTIYDTFGIYADGNGDPVEFDPELGEGSEPEGYGMDDTGPGSYDDTSDSISDVPDPSYGILDAGFVNVYKVSTGALTALGNDVFPQLSSVTDLVSGLQCVSDMLFNSRLIDYVLDVHIIPCNVPAGSPTAVKVGGRTCSAQGDPVTANYVNVDLGKINIKEYFKSFADYSYTSSKLHLPFVGFVDMKPEFWNGGELNVKYKFNVADGSFMAYVYATSSKSELKSSLVAEYSGQAAIHIPVTGASYASAISGLLASAGQTIASATTGNVAGVAQGVISAAANTSPDINQSNGYNSSASIMGSKKAYLQIERPAYSMSTYSQKEQGFPLNVTYKVGQMSGFTKADDLILDGIPCTESEKEKIRNMFRSGVIIRNLS